MTMTHRPKITVFIPVFNRAAYVGEAIDSILAQSFDDFELLLVDDGSEDESLKVIKSRKDPRIRVVSNERNLGIPRTRNRGLELARGEYIALLDSDDRAHPDRLKKQVEFLDRHPDFVQVGSWCRMMDIKGRSLKKIKRQPVLPFDVDAQLLYRCALSNRSIMARTDILREYGYREDYPRCQDYDLHVRLVRKYKMANLPFCLVYGRIHPEQITTQTTELGDDRKQEIVRSQLIDLGASFEQADLIPHLDLSRMRKRKIVPDRPHLEWIEHWLLGLQAANRRTQRYDREAFDHAIRQKWIQACGAAGRGLKWSALKIFLGSPLRRGTAATSLRHISARAQGRQLLDSA